MRRVTLVASALISQSLTSQRYVRALLYIKAVRESEDSVGQPHSKFNVVVVLPPKKMTRNLLARKMAAGKKRVDHVAWQIEVVTNEEWEELVKLQGLIGNSVYKQLKLVL